MESELGLESEILSFGLIRRRLMLTETKLKNLKPMNATYRVADGTLLQIEGLVAAFSAELGGAAV